MHPQPGELLVNEDVLSCGPLPPFRSIEEWAHSGEHTRIPSHPATTTGLSIAISLQIRKRSKCPQVALGFLTGTDKGELVG